jgi:hypothetical protein
MPRRPLADAPVADALASEIVDHLDATTFAPSFLDRGIVVGLVGASRHARGSRYGVKP